MNDFNWKDCNKTVEIFNRILDVLPEKNSDTFYPLERLTHTVAKKLFKDEFGIIKVSTNSILSKKATPGIMAAVNKTSYFLNKLKTKHPDILEGYHLLNTYIKDSDYLIFEGPFGKVRMTPERLLINTKFSISAALNKTDYFIQECKSKFGEKWDYSEFKYDTNYTKTTVICKFHGGFLVTPGNHKAGKGCPNCRDEAFRLREGRGEDLNEIPYYLYIINLVGQDENFFKVGITRDINQRLYRLNLSKYSATLVHSYKYLTEECKRIESYFLRQFIKFRYYPKHLFPGHTECVSIDPVALEMESMFTKHEKDLEMCEEYGEEFDYICK